jgi:hypothetical protein
MPPPRHYVGSMNKPARSFAAALLTVTILAAPLTLTTGCALTVPQQDLVAKIVARRATIEVLRAKPEYRPAFSATVVVIDLLLKQDGATRADFVAAIQTLKIKELRGADGAALIADLLDILDAAVGDKPWIGDGLPRLKSVLLAVSDGIADGLALTILAE